ncbi:MAG: hypothetical protein KME30_29290 [Iphinoe sp. HA4291-MV1]|jgi:hypothetical protein|nr:hypothetical protein [Iphinoe sp. HA4291-MV1]
MKIPTQTITGTDLTGKQRTLDRSEPPLLSLFQTFLPSTEKYSNTIELYDALPKYYPSPKKMASLREQGKFLNTLERNFKHRGKSYRVQIYPARIEVEDGKFIEYYPTEREQLVEEALRKIATDSLSGVFLNEKAGVQFTLNQLMRELKKYDHSISYPALIEALTICNRTNLTVKSGDGATILQSPIFPTVLIKSRKEWLNEPRDAYCYVQFNPLVTVCLENLSYRQFDYNTSMRLSQPLTRWLHKRISHYYIQANLLAPYKIKATTIIRDSGLITDEKFSRALNTISKCLDDLKNPLPQSNDTPTDSRLTVLLGYNADRISEGRRIVDIQYTLRPSPYFVQEAKLANSRQNKIVELSSPKTKP